MQYQDDPIIHGLFISIIKLFKFVCIEENKNLSDPDNKFRHVSGLLNRMSRDQALFSCLEVPNDEVKLAVVQCLFYVPLSQFDGEEIQ